MSIVIDNFEYPDDPTAQGVYVSSDSGAVLLIEQANEGQNWGLGDFSGVENRLAQSFVLSATTLIKGASVLFGLAVGSPAGDITYRIETNSGSSLPSGSLADPNATKTFTPTLESWNQENFSTPFFLAPGTYWLVIQCDDQGLNDAWYLRHPSSDDYADGTAATSVDGGSTWAAISGDRDLAFRIYTVNLQCFSEDTIKQQGSYSLKVVARQTGSLNDTLTRTVSPTIDLTNVPTIKLYIRSTRTGSNIKVGIRDSGGLTTEITPNITSANIFQLVEWDISGVSASDKDTIDRIIATMVNADSETTFYLDFMVGVVAYIKTLTETISLSDTLQKKPAKTFAEILNLTDTLQKKPTKTFIESLTLGDTLIKAISKVFSESISLNDVYSRVCAWFRTFSDTITLTDSVKKAVNKRFSETITLADSLRKKVTKTFTESITLTDIYLKVWRIYRTFTENINLIDTFRKRITKTFIETLHLQDTYTRVVTWYRTFTENVTLTDTIIKVKSNLVQLWKKLMNLFDIEG